MKRQQIINMISTISEGREDSKLESSLLYDEGEIDSMLNALADGVNWLMNAPPEIIELFASQVTKDHAHRHLKDMGLCSCGSSCACGSKQWAKPKREVVGRGDARRSIVLRVTIALKE